MPLDRDAFLGATDRSNQSANSPWRATDRIAPLACALLLGFLGGVVVTKVSAPVDASQDLIAPVPEVKWEPTVVTPEQGLVAKKSVASGSDPAFDELATGSEPVPQVCAVVGVGPGLGEHLAKRFASAGCKVALLARHIEPLEKMVTEIPGSKAYACDATDKGQVASTFAAIKADLGEVDTLIYNVAAGSFGTFDKITPEQLDLNMNAGALGLLLTSQAVVPGMLARGHGSIAVTGAAAAWRAVTYTAGFAPGLFAVRALAQSMAKDLGPKGVHVFHVVIMGRIFDESLIKDGKMPSDDLHPKDIAETYYFLARQPRSAWTSELSIDAYGDLPNMYIL